MKNLKFNTNLNIKYLKSCFLLEYYVFLTTKYADTVSLMFYIVSVLTV